MNRFGLAALAAFVSMGSASAQPPSDAAQIVSVLDHVCLPQIAGGDARAIARAAGVKQNRDGDLVMALGGGKSITVQAPSTANPTLCSVTALYDPAGDAAVVEAIKAWVAARPTPLSPDRVAEKSQTGAETRTTWTWKGSGPATSEGLVLIESRRADGAPLNGKTGQATILLSVTPNH